METVVRLRRGKAPRHITLTLKAPPDLRSTTAATRVLAAFLRAVDAGFFGPPNTPVGTETLHAVVEDETWTGTWRLRFPKLLPEAFGPLVAMAKASIPGLLSLDLREEGPEPALLVRGFDSETEATIRELPWTLRFVAAELPSVRLVFRERPGAEAATRAEEALTAWTDVVALGGFPPADRPASAARRPKLSWPDPSVLLSELALLSCSYLAYEALFEALFAADPEAGLSLVEIGAPARSPR